MKTLFLLGFILLSVLHFQSIILENQRTLLFFMEQLLPSLFLLCVLIQMLPLPEKTKPHPLLQTVFRMDTASFFIVVKAILLGNPAGSYMINSLVKDHKITQAQAQRLIYCISVPSISFMLMSLAFMTSRIMAMIVFVIHLSGIVFLLFITRKTEITLSCHFEKVSLYQSILFSFHTMALILSYLFISSSVKTLLLIYFPHAKIAIQLIMEFSSGCAYFATYQNILFFLLICLGFGGLCAHLQIMSGCLESHLKYHRYLIFRIIHIIFSLSIFFMSYIFTFF